MRTIAALLALVPLALAAPAVAAEKDIEKVPSCQYCGMDRAKFASTRMYVEYEDGSVIGTCSVHCAAIDLSLSFGKAIKAIHVADAKGGRLIDAEKAVWVVGGDQRGVMAKQNRLAFAERADAEAFTKEKGGEIADWERAITSTYADMWADTQMIRSRRTKGGGGMKMGE